MSIARKVKIGNAVTQGNASGDDHNVHIKVSAKRIGGAKKQKAGHALFANSPMSFIEVSDPAEIIMLIRKGLPSQAIDSVAGLLSLSRASFLEAIKIPVSTIERRLRRGESLTAEESDRVSRVAKVLRRAVEVFDDVEQGKAWMTDTVSSLGGNTPVSLLDTMEGSELVLDTLSRIEFGVFG